MSGTTEHTGINIVQSISNTSQLLKEVIGVDVLSLRTNTVHLCIDVYRRIHLFHRCRSCRRLGFLYTSSITHLYIFSTTTTTTYFSTQMQQQSNIQLGFNIIWTAKYVILQHWTACMQTQTCTSHGRNRNCRLRFDFSMTSMSVTIMCPLEPTLTPIIAQFFNISQPIAPAPTCHIQLM